MQAKHLPESGSANHGEYFTHDYFLQKMVSNKIIVHIA